MEDDFERVSRALSRNLRGLRSKREMSQEALALNADVDRTYVSQIERGTGNPSLKVLCKLAGVLGVRVVELFGESGTAGVSRLEGLPTRVRNRPQAATHASYLAQDRAAERGPAPDPGPTGAQTEGG